MKLIQLSRVLVVALITAGAIPAFAQPAPPDAPAQPAQPGQPGQPGGRNGGRGNFDPAAMRQRMLDRIKEQLGATDDEWTAISPKIEKVTEAQRSTRTGGGFGGRTRGGQPAATPAADATPNPVADATKALQAAIEKKDTPADELKSKLTALRDARAKAKETLTADQKDLQALLTQRQEAILVEMGLLE